MLERKPLTLINLNNHARHIFELRQKEAADSTLTLIWQTATIPDWSVYSKASRF